MERRGIGVGNQLRASGRPDLRHLVHLRHRRQRVVAHHAGGLARRRRAMRMPARSTRQRPAVQQFLRHGTVPTMVGSGTLTFTDANTGSFVPYAAGNERDRRRRRSRATTSAGAQARVHLQRTRRTSRRRPTTRTCGGMRPNRGGGSTSRTRATDLRHLVHVRRGQRAPLWLSALLTRQGASKSTAVRSYRTSVRDSTTTTPALPVAQIRRHGDGNVRGRQQRNVRLFDQRQRRSSHRQSSQDDFALPVRWRHCVPLTDFARADEVGQH